jgi:alcohol dehydrogenase (NADP+)
MRNQMTAQETARARDEHAPIAPEILHILILTAENAEDAENFEGIEIKTRFVGAHCNAPLHDETYEYSHRPEFFKTLRSLRFIARFFVSETAIGISDVRRGVTIHRMSTTFHIAADGVDPNRVPKQVLASGAQIPAIGLGTFGSDHVSGEQIAQAVIGAAEVGYRHFDCASVYGNEELIGQSLQTILRGGVQREELWINSKLWNDKHAEADVIPACEKSLRDLGLDYLDLYMVHWPFPNYHAPGVDVTARDPHAKPYVHENFMKTWRQMERLVETGLVRHIGTSNMTIPKLQLLLRDCDIKPACNEMELHPHFQQPQLFDFVTQNNIVPIGYSPVGSPARPERDRTPDDTVDIEDPVIVEIAARHNIHPATLCVKWAVQRGQIPIPMSVTRRNYLANLQATISAPLSDEEMQQISQIDRNCRLIKGQVFLWQGADDWRALWDEDGEISN